MSDPMQQAVNEPVDEKPAWWVQWLDVLVSFWKLWAIVFLVGACVILLIVAAVGWSWPRWVRVSAISAVVAAPYGYLVVLKARSLWPSQNYVYGVEFAVEDESRGGIWRWPITRFRENAMTDGGGSLDWVHQNLFFARKIDDREKAIGEELEGSWRGTLEDRDLAWSLQKVAECRGELVEDAARGFVLESSMWVTTFAASRNAVAELREMIEDGTLPDHGESVDQAIVSAISDSGLDELIEDVPDEMDLPDSMGAEKGAFSQPLGDYDYEREAEDAAGNGDLGADVEVPDDVEIPDRELSADD